MSATLGTYLKALTRLDRSICMNAWKVLWKKVPMAVTMLGSAMLLSACEMNYTTLAKDGFWISSKR